MCLLGGTLIKYKNWAEILYNPLKAKKEKLNQVQGGVKSDIKRSFKKNYSDAIAKKIVKIRRSWFQDDLLISSELKEIECTKIEVQELLKLKKKGLQSSLFILVLPPNLPFSIISIEL